MSYTIYLKADVGGDEPARIEHEHLNYTWNVSPMFHGCGLALNDLPYGMPAGEAAKLIRSTIEKLRAEPERFRAMNPENGWGDYDSAVLWLEEVAELCERYPKAMFCVG